MRPILAFALLFAACNDIGSSEAPRQHLPRPENPTFTLLVSNQSFDLSEVDIEVRFDGQLAVTGDFHVEGQHTWIPFDFDLAPGTHQLSVSSEAGDTTLEQTFEMDARKWGVLDFWYYGAGSPDPTPKKFTFQTHDEPPVFE
jgi:hypothetical protein